MVVSFKKCTKCNKVKPMEEFRLDKSKPDGHYPRCRSCLKEDRYENKERTHTYYIKHKERIISKIRERQRTYPMSSTSYERQLKNGKRWRADNQERVKELAQQAVMELKDFYVAAILRQGGTEVTPETIILKRQQVLMKRTLKQFKKWREENESDSADVQTEQYENEENYGRDIQAG